MRSTPTPIHSPSAVTLSSPLCLTPLTLCFIRCCVILCLTLNLTSAQLIYAETSDPAIQASDRDQAGKDQTKVGQTGESQVAGVHLYGSVLGFANGSFISEPKSKTLEVMGQVGELPYPGFGGFGGGAGFSLGARWRALSLDVGLEWSFDSAEGRIDDQAVTLSQTTMHIPISLRAGLPSGAVRPSIFGGVDFVSPSDVSLDVPFTFSGSITGVESESYTAGRFGLGFDFVITDQLRIPLRLVGIYAPTAREDLSERVVIDELIGNNVKLRYFSKWEWQARVSLGVTYEFKTL